VNVYLGQMEFRSYTLTVVADSEEKAFAAMRKEYNRACKSSGGGHPTFLQYAEDSGFYVQIMTPGKVEWL
jgi:hypothetical protein